MNILLQLKDNNDKTKCSDEMRRDFIRLRSDLLPYFKKALRRYNKIEKIIKILQNDLDDSLYNMFERIYLDTILKNMEHSKYDNVLL